MGVSGALVLGGLQGEVSGLPATFCQPALIPANNDVCGVGTVHDEVLTIPLCSEMQKCKNVPSGLLLLIRITSTKWRRPLQCFYCIF